MKFPYRVKFGGVYYDAGMEVPMPVSDNTVEPKTNKIASDVEPKNESDAKKVNKKIKK